MDPGKLVFHKEGVSFHVIKEKCNDPTWIKTKKNEMIQLRSDFIFF